MSNAIEDRLRELKINLAVANTNPDDNRLYIGDLQVSIAYCQLQLDKLGMHGIPTNA